MIMKCDHKNKKILLFPDFSSTGIWCECGCSIGNPVEFYMHVPEGLFELVQLWNNYWDSSCYRDTYWWSGGDPEKEEIEYCQNRINIMGQELSKNISRYHPCVFMEDRSKIFFPKGLQ